MDFAPMASDDLRLAISYYNNQQANLGTRFYKQVKESLKVLKVNPFFQIRYDNVRCLPIKKFPFMVHFIVEESSKSVIVIGIINTHLDPEKNYR